MRAFWLRWIVNAGVLLVVAETVNGPGPGGHDVFEVGGFLPALGAVFLITVANLLLQPLAKIVAGFGCVFNVLTLGLFGAVLTFVFYAVAFWLVGTLDPFGGFYVAGMKEAAIGAFWLAAANALLQPLLGGRDEPRQRDRDERRDEDRRR